MMISVRQIRWPDRFILVADELSANLLAELPEQQLAGVIVRDGATHSHSAIFSASNGDPLPLWGRYSTGSYFTTGC